MDHCLAPNPSLTCNFEEIRPVPMLKRQQEYLGQALVRAADGKLSEVSKWSRGANRAHWLPRVRVHRRQTAARSPTRLPKHGRCQWHRHRLPLLLYAMPSDLVGAREYSW